MMDYRGYRNKTIALRASRDSTIKSNSKYCDSIRDTITILKDMDLSFADMLGVDYSFVHEIDYNRLASDAGYLSQITNKVENGLDKMINTLEEAGL